MKPSLFVMLIAMMVNSNSDGSDWAVIQVVLLVLFAYVLMVVDS